MSIQKIILISLILTSFAQSKNEFDGTTVKKASFDFNKDGTYNIIDDVFDPVKYIAAAKYTKGLETIGWDLLAIQTNSKMNDNSQAFAAGYLEGYLTKDRILTHWNNMNKYTWSKNPFNDVHKSFYVDQEQYIKDAYAKQTDDKVLNQAYLITTQFDALVEAYNHYNTNSPIPKVDFHTMASFGEIFDSGYYKNKDRPNFASMSSQDIVDYLHKTTHCSALFKTKEDFSDIFFGHNSWFTYSATTRIFKEYNFNYSNAAAKNIMFSSYPAVLASGDDFYITSQDLVVIETTNVIYNTDLYDLLSPNTLLTWQRAMIANRLAKSSFEWVNTFAQHNSGTYNNQFMALDMKKVDLDKRVIKDDAMYIIEQLPGFYDINDVTSYLRLGYWPSYNIPYSQTIFKLSNIQHEIDTKPEAKSSLSYDTCGRAKIFRRDQSQANTEEKFKALMRYNQFLSDPFSEGNAGLTISSRHDLNPPEKRPSCGGAYDAKMSSVSQAKGKNKKIQIVMGPTNQGQIEFSWATSNICANQPKEGLPTVYNFKWITYENEFVDDSIKYLED